jgi:Major Facilitator Superfamily.
MFYSISGLASGFLYGKISYVITTFISSAMIGMGIIASSYANNIQTIYFFYGFIFGFGAGFTFKSIITAIITWFPDRAGFAGGVLLMGVGLTACIFNVPTSYMISLYGWRVALRIVGSIALCLSMLSAILVRPKKNDIKVTKKRKSTDIYQYNTLEMMRSIKFYFYFVWSVVLLASCTCIAGNSSSIAKSFGISATLAAVLSTIISLFNSVSRVFYGIIFDKKGRKIAMTISTSLFILAVICLFISLISKNASALVLTYILIGLSFGASPSISSAYILKTFGGENYASNFSIQGTYTLFSSLLGSTLFGILFAKNNSYLLSFRFLIIYALIAPVSLLILNIILKKDETETNVELQKEQVV